MRNFGKCWSGVNNKQDMISIWKLKKTKTKTKKMKEKKQSWKKKKSEK